MKWIVDWPVIGVDPDGDGRGEPVVRYRKPDVGRNYPLAAPQASDEFNANRIGFQWQWQANHQISWASLTVRRGWLRLNAQPIPESARNLWAVSNLLLQKLPAPEFTVTTRIDFAPLGPGQKTGLIVMGMNYSYLAVERDASGFHIARYSCVNASDGNAEMGESKAQLPGTTALLRVRVSNGAFCDFSFSVDGKTFVPIGKSFKAREGRWIGAKVGLFCLDVGRNAAGHADFDWFRFESSGQYRER